MKALLIFLVMSGLAAAALFVPVGGRSFWERAQERGIPAAAARATAHGLRHAWDWLASLGQHPAETAPVTEKHAPPRHASRKAQAAAAHRIVAQPPKEHLEQKDKAALDDLIAHGR